MRKEDFNDLVRRLKGGDNSALIYLQPYQDACMRMLIARSGYRCSRDQAYDIVLDSLLDFRRNVLQDKVTFQNIPAYVHRICWNKWLESSRRNMRETDAEDTVRAQLYGDAERIDIALSKEKLHTEQITRIESGMNQLSERCRQILYLSIADERSMEDIAQRLELASADVAKTLKSRCFKKLLLLIRNEKQ